MLYNYLPCTKWLPARKGKPYRKRPRELKREGKLAEKAARSRPGLLTDVATILAMAENTLLDAQSLKDSARLEDLTVRMEAKTRETNRSTKTYTGYMACMVVVVGKSAQHSPGELQGALWGGGPAEGQGDEGGIPGEVSNVIEIFGRACLTLKIVLWHF
jgi:hypothetical protein